MGSSRYPGKPLREIHGMPMVEHVYRRVQLSDTVEETYVATPDTEIREAVDSFGGNTVLTGSHTRGTDRVAEAVEGIDADVIVKVHTDEPLITPEMVDDAVEPVLTTDDIAVVNLARPIENHAEFRNPNNVKVVTDGAGNALYYSRAPIPNHHRAEWGEVRIDHQICVVPMERDILLEYSRLDQGPLERTEGIDMMRLLEHGRSVHVVRTDRRTASVDTPADHERAAELMAADDLFSEYAP
jgi:3-deoxy-manno-octulosonate cytidylyltransferase (CMP-KDO synthetase)